MILTASDAEKPILIRLHYFFKFNNLFEVKNLKLLKEPFKKVKNVF